MRIACVRYAHVTAAARARARRPVPRESIFPFAEPSAPRPPAPRLPPAPASASMNTTPGPASLATLPEEERTARIAKARERTVSVSRHLDDIAHLSLFLRADVERVQELWRTYHADKYCVAGVVGAPLYRELHTLWLRYPLFVLPLPRAEGVEFFVMRVSDAGLLSITALAAYQTDGDKAVPALQLMHYSELEASHGLVLMRGKIDPAQLDVQEAQTLANAAQLFYLDPARLKLVESFHERPHEFEYKSLLDLSAEEVVKVAGKDDE